MYRGGTGLTGAFDGALSGVPAVSWRHTTSYFYHNPSSPAVVGGTAYFAAGNRVYAVDEVSGALKWRYPQDRDQGLDTVIRTSPAVADGLVYVGAQSGELTALDAEKGTKLWAFNTRSAISSSPAIANGVVYFGSVDGRLWALDAKTGAEVNTWKGGLKLTDEITGAPAVANDNVFVLTMDSTLISISAASGRSRGAQKVNGSVLGMSPVVSGDAVYVAAGSNIYYFYGRNLSLRRVVNLPVDATAAPAVTEETVYIPCRDQRIYAFDARTGKAKWRNGTKLDFDIVASPSISGSSLYVGTLQGEVYALNAETGEITWTYVVEPNTTREDAVMQNTSIGSSPVIAKGSLYILSDDGSLTCFRGDAGDTDPPAVVDLELPIGRVPSNTAPTTNAINGTPPLYFEARLIDYGSGLNVDSIKMLLDGQPVPKRSDKDVNKETEAFEYDMQKALLKFNTKEPAGATVVRILQDGRHTFTVIASDHRGNTLTKTWTFMVDNTLKRLPRKTNTNTNTGQPGGLGGPGAPGGGGKGGS
jgi:outer membrane protein assembly factor BamB